MNRIFGLLTVSLVTLFSITAICEAQFTSTVGTSSLTGQRFDCVSYPKGQDIVIYERNGKSRKVSKKKADSNIETSLARSDKRISGLKGSLKDKNARIKKLLNSPTLVLPSVAKELDQLKLDIPRLEALLEQAIAQKTELKFLRTAVKACGKEPPAINGSNVIVQYAIQLPKSGDQAYGIHAVHSFLVPAGVPDRICVSFDDGPYYERGILYSVGATFYDGSGTSNLVSHSEPAPIGTGYLPIFGQAGLFRHGKYDEDLAEVKNELSHTFKMFIPTAKKTCPRA